MGLNELGAEAIQALPLDIIWIIDSSSAMSPSIMENLNRSLKYSLEEMKKQSANIATSEIYTRLMTFDHSVHWYTKKRTPIKSFVWEKLNESMVEKRNLGIAIDELCKILSPSLMPARGLPPVLILVLAGNPSDYYLDSLNKLTDRKICPWGSKSVRLALSVGSDVDLKVLTEFIGSKNIEPLRAENSNDLLAYVKWVSTTVVSAVSTSRSSSSNASQRFNIIIPEAPISIQINKDTEFF